MLLKVALNIIMQTNKRHLKLGHPSRSLSKIKYPNIYNAIKMNILLKLDEKIKGSNFEIFPFWPLLCKNGNGYIVMRYIFLREISYEIIIIIIIIIYNIYIAHDLIKKLL